MSEEKKGWFSRLKKAIIPTKEGLIGRIASVTIGRTKVDEELYQEMEDILIGADVGVTTTLKIIEQVREKRPQEPTQLKDFIAEEISLILKHEEGKLNMSEESPTVIMVVGVNGTGKTTTIAKLAARFKAEGKSVLLAAADTFRAAAIEQLEIWANRVNVSLIKHQPGADPGAVTYDAIQSVKARNTDVLIVDTAGRLHTKSNLMNELAKVRRVCQAQLPGAPHEVLLILDATCGQNGLLQAKQFAETVGVTGLALTKLDGTAKGGIVIAISDQLALPVKLIGCGETLEDLIDFSGADFSRALFEDEVD